MCESGQTKELSVVARATLNSTALPTIEQTSFHGRTVLKSYRKADEKYDRFAMAAWGRRE
jgi:hypothetical protein